MDNAHLITFKTFEPGGWNEEQPSCVRMIFNPTPASIEELNKLVAEAKARYDGLTPEQKAEHDRQQRESWVRGMMPTGDPRFD